VSVIQQIQFIKKQVEVLLHHAARDKNPELYAEVMLDNLPPYITPEVILQHIGADDAIAKLALLDSRVTQYAEWFEEFRQHVIAFLTPDADERPDAGGADGVDLDNPVEGAD
jgi:hypothetical protein